MLKSVGSFGADLLQIRLRYRELCDTNFVHDQQQNGFSKRNRIQFVPDYPRTHTYMHTQHIYLIAPARHDTRVWCQHHYTLEHDKYTCSRLCCAGVVNLQATTMLSIMGIMPHVNRSRPLIDRSVSATERDIGAPRSARDDEVPRRVYLGARNAPSSIAAQLHWQNKSFARN